MSVSTFWSESQWGREYGWRPGPGQANPYDLGYHIAQDIQGGAWLGPVPVLRAGVIVQTGRSSKIGGFVTIRADADGLHDTYCHLNTSWMPAKQTRMRPGDDLPKLARSKRIQDGHDYMGSASDGPHCHFAITRTIDGAYNLRRGNDIDPRPIIRTALAGQASGGGSTPFDPEEDDMFTDDDRRKLTLAADAVTPGQVNVKFDGQTYAKAKEAAANAKAALDAIARIEAVVVGDIDRQGGAMGGKTNLRAMIAWSDQNNIVTRQQLTDGIAAMTKSVVDALAKVPGVDPKVVQEAIAKSIGGTALDPKVVAKAVAEDLAQRLQS